MTDIAWIVIASLASLTIALAVEIRRLRHDLAALACSTVVVTQAAAVLARTESEYVDRVARELTKRVAELEAQGPAIRG